MADAGIAAPRRIVGLMAGLVDRLGLDLRDLVVVTEAGSGAYALTPVLAAMAGARHVRAITRDSSWGTVSEVRATVEAACTLAGVSGGVELTTSRDRRAFEDADIVTNLGFVRPIGAEIVRWLKPTAVVPLMCEAWEARPGDVDVRACRDHGILVLATNEHDPLCDVFRYSGPLAGRLLLDAGFELLDVRVAVAGTDRFAPVILEWLRGAGVHATHIRPGAEGAYDELQGVDVLLVAEYATGDPVVGNGAMIDAARLAAAAPWLTVVQFAGAIDGSALARHGLRCWPPEPVPPHRMARTFAALGPAPVVRLHAGGLKVGELGVRARQRCSHLPDAERRALAASSLVQATADPETR